jgi:hypothetical protein
MEPDFLSPELEWQMPVNPVTAVCTPELHKIPHKNATN